MSRLNIVLVVSAAALSLGACATVTRGNSTAWEVNTTPSGAKVKTSNGFYCESTPCSLSMPRRAEFDASISKDGYKPLQIHVSHKIATAGGAGMAGNVLLGGVIGAGVDVATGAMYDLTPNPANITLEKLETASTPIIPPGPVTPPAPVVAPATPVPPSPSGVK